MLTLRKRSACRPEKELLLSCARPCANQETIKALVAKQIDWSYLLRIASRHGVTPLLYRHLSATRPEVIPKRILSQLRDYFRDNVARNLFLSAELLRLLELFAANDIQAMPFKGPVLSHSLYGDLALRTFEDLDILVDERDLTSVSRLLISQRYRCQFQLSDQQQRVYAKVHHAIPFTHVDSSIIVDVHWALTPPVLHLAPDAKGLWERCGTGSVLGREIQTFSPEDLLLFLCVHGTKHHWASLSWIADIAFLISRFKGINWSQLSNQATFYGSERMLLLGLFLASELLGTLLPNKVSKELENRADVAALADEVGKNLFRNLDVQPGRFEGYTFYLRAMDRSVDRLKHCYLELVPTPLEWALLPLPPYLAPFYYLLRPIRLLGKYVAQLIRHVSVGMAKGS